MIRDDEGSAVVEFLGGTLVLLIPLIYLVLVLNSLLGATFAAEGAARDAGRLVATATTPDGGLALAQRAVELSFADQGLAVDGESALTVTCEDLTCTTGGATVHVAVSTSVPLPLVPAWLGVPSTVPVTAEAWSAVDRFRERE